MSSPNATDTDPTGVDSSGHFQGSPYGYVPTLWICALFVALYSLSGLLHIVQAAWTRLWFLFPTAVLADIAEILGWAARVWSSKNPSLLNPYLMQIVTTIIAPTPLVAANFVILGELIKRLGPQYSRLSAMWYTVVFCSCDIIALIVQAVGGAAASNAVHENKDPARGGNIMLGGIAFQLASISIYVALASEFILRFLTDRPVRKVTGATSDAPRYLDRKVKLMLIGLGFSSITLFIRSVYRTIELADGWTGRVISTQVYFNVLDGAMIVLATFTLNFFHPGLLLGRGDTWNRKHYEPETKSLDTMTETPAQSGEGEKDVKSPA